MSAQRSFLARSVTRQRVANRIKTLELERAELLRSFPELQQRIVRVRATDPPVRLARAHHRRHARPTH